MSTRLEPEHQDCLICDSYAKEEPCGCHPEKRASPYDYCCCYSARSLMRWKEHKVLNEILAETRKPEFVPPPRSCGERDPFSHGAC